jgi:hypothetical protein
MRHGRIRAKSPLFGSQRKKDAADSSALSRQEKRATREGAVERIATGSSNGPQSVR